MLLKASKKLKFSINSLILSTFKDFGQKNWKFFPLFKLFS